MTTHLCFALQCETQIPLDMLMCKSHWRLVPNGVQNAVYSTWRDVSAAKPGMVDAEALRQYEEARLRARLCVQALHRPMVDRPLLFVGHPNAKASHGPGRKWCGMGLPRHWEHGEGRVEYLAPYPELVKQHKDQEVDTATYRGLYEHRLSLHVERGHLVPGALSAKLWTSEEPFLTRGSQDVAVLGGDTVWCACGKDKAHQGRCHLSWAVPSLVASGWQVEVFGQRHPIPVATPQLGLFGGPT